MIPPVKEARRTTKLLYNENFVFQSTSLFLTPPRFLKAKWEA